MLANHLTTQIHEKLEADYQRAELYFKRAFPRPLVQFTLRGKSAGTAHLQLNKIRLNPILLNENPQTFLEHVLPHEISHLLAYQLFGKVKPHGKEWQSIMLGVFKQPARTTHQLNVASVQGKQFDYRCACGITPLTIRRHNKVQRGQINYRCKRCGDMLSLAN